MNILHMRINLSISLYKVRLCPSHLSRLVVHMHGTFLLIRQGRDARTKEVCVCSQHLSPYTQYITSIYRSYLQTKMYSVRHVCYHGPFPFFSFSLVVALLALVHLI
jgi:hypothetical protein